jgi:hypothetical protein
MKIQFRFFCDNFKKYKIIQSRLRKAATASEPESWPKKSVVNVSFVARRSLPRFPPDLSRHLAGQRQLSLPSLSTWPQTPEYPTCGWPPPTCSSARLFSCAAPGSWTRASNRMWRPSLTQRHLASPYSHALGRPPLLLPGSLSVSSFPGD